MHTISLTGNVVMVFMTFVVNVVEGMKNPINILIERLDAEQFGTEIGAACPEKPDDMDREFDCKISEQSRNFINKYCDAFFNELNNDPAYQADPEIAKMSTSMEYLRKSLESAVSTVPVES